MKLRKHIYTFFALLLTSFFLLTGCSPEMEELAVDVLTAVAESENEAFISEDGIYTAKEEVAA